MVWAFDSQDEMFNLLVVSRKYGNKIPRNYIPMVPC